MQLLLVKTDLESSAIQLESSTFQFGAVTIRELSNSIHISENTISELSNSIITSNKYNCRALQFSSYW